MATRWARLVSLLAAGIALAALIAPAAAFAAVGGPYSESISNPDDNGIVNIGTDGGSYPVGSSGLVTFEVPAGAVPAPTPVTVTVTRVSGGPRTFDGGDVRYVIDFEPDGFVFDKPVTVSCTAPTGMSNPRWWGWDAGAKSWTAQASGRSGDKVTTSIGHFSSYGIGGDPLATTNTPASSDWSLALIAVAGFAMAAVAARRMRGGVAM